MGCRYCTESLKLQRIRLQARVAEARMDPTQASDFIRFLQDPNAVTSSLSQPAPLLSYTGVPVPAWTFPGLLHAATATSGAASRRYSDVYTFVKLEICTPAPCDSHPSS